MNRCPSCSSDTVQCFRAIYEGGTAFYDGVSNSTATAYGNNGSITAIGTTRHGGVSRTVLASRVSPPGKRSIIKPMISIIIGIFFPFGLFIPFGPLLIVPGLIYLIAAIQYNNNKYPELASIWNRSLYCHKCATAFEFN